MASRATHTIRAGFGATTQIDRRDFGITMGLPMDAGGVVVGYQVQVRLDVEAVLSEPDTDAP